MSSPRVYTHKVFEGADWQPLDLFTYGDGELPIHSEITDIDIRIFKGNDPTVIHEFLALSPGNGTTGPIFNTPLLDAGWKQGPPGYNFKRRIQMSVLEAVPIVIEPGQRYRVEIILNGTPEGRLISVHEYLVRDLASLPE